MFLSLLLIFVASANSALIPTAPNSGRWTRSTRLYTCYECVGDECDNPYNKTCDGAYSCYTATEIIENKYYLHLKGCYTHPFVNLALCLYGNKTANLSNCCQGNFCNDDEFQSVPSDWTPPPELNAEKLDTEKIHLPHEVPKINYYCLIIVIIICFTVSFGCGVLSFTVLAVSDSKWRDLLTRKNRKPTPNGTFDSFPTSGSGSGLPTLNQRCMAQDVSLIKCIGQGRFGEVWQGTWHGENVAVKIFSSKDEASWQNEVNIYTNIALYHENVLGFKGSDIATRFGATEMWLLTAFHQRGSLYDYLLENTVTYYEMMAFVRSISSGLLHLHTEIFGSRGKPAIAHRDLKTRNILLTSHATCVIADFGLAIVKSNVISNPYQPVNYRVGTKRYMAPEILDGSMKTHSFDSFKRADIYAFGLILWEICSRCITSGAAEAYCPPFHDCVPNNPDFEDMKKVVCIELKRPEIPDRWSYNKSMNAMAMLMKECWHKTPEVRSTVCRVKKTLDKIREEMQSPEQVVIFNHMTNLTNFPSDLHSLL